MAIPTLTQKITAITDYVESLDILSSWGGWCHNQTDKELPYGISLDPSCNGNIYSYNENEISGYLFLNNIASTNSEIKNEVLVTASIYIFTPYKAIGNKINTYEVPLAIFGQLNKHFTSRHKFRFSTQTVQKYFDKEIALIDIEFLFYGDCSIPAFNNPIC